MSQILSHRGLDPDTENFPAESTYAAYEAHLKKGFGIEFDINFSNDNKIFIFHDTDLGRITNNRDKRQFSELTLNEIRTLKFGGSFLPAFEELAGLISSFSRSINALHLKSKFQDRDHLDILIGYLKNCREIFDDLIIFDVKIETARFLKEKLPELNLTPSVAHPHDIARYNDIVGGTLYAIDEVIANKDVFNWAWLDEWDLTDKEGGSKKLYAKKTFDRFRTAGIKTALVSPELHGTSPGLLGGEAHPDGVNMERLIIRIKEIISLSPDAICTDHPDLINSLL